MTFDTQITRTEPTPEGWSVLNLRELAAPVLIFLLALVARLVCLAVFYGFEDPNPVDQKYLILADQLVENDWIYPGVFAYSPVYIYFLAATKVLVGDRLIWILVIQSVVGALAVTVLFLLAKELFDSLVGALAGVIAAVYHQFLLYDTEIYSDCLAGVLQWTALLLALRAVTRRSGSAAILSGLFVGLAALQRPTAILLLAVILGWFIFSWRSAGLGHYLRPLLGLLVGAVMVVLPITFHNSRVGGDFVPIVSQGGYVLYSSNNHRSTGAQYFPPTVALEHGTARIGPWSFENQRFYDDELMSRHIASKVVRKELSPSEATSFWSAETRKYISENPREFLALLGRKILFVFHSWEVHDLYSIRAKVGQFANPLWTFSSVVLMPLCVVGLVASVPRWRQLILIYLSMIVSIAGLMLFYVAERFMLPLLGLVIMFASYALADFVGLIRARGVGSRPVIARCGVFLLLVIALSWNYAPIERQKKMETSAQLVRDGRTLMVSNPDLAVAKLERASRMDPLSPKAFEAHFLLSRIHRQQGRPTMADSEEQIYGLRHPSVLNEVLRRLDEDPEDEEARYTLGLIRFREGDFTSATSELERAVSLKPSHPRRWTHWAQALISAGTEHYGTALIALETAIDKGEKFEPESAALHLKAALLCLRLGETEKAVAHLEQCLFESPNLVEARYVHRVALRGLGGNEDSRGQREALDGPRSGIGQQGDSNLTIESIEERYLWR